MARYPRFPVRAVVTGALLALAPAGAALAQGGDTPVPEPSNIVLFAVGVLGLILGRRNGRRRD